MSLKDSELEYLSGFGSYHSTEAIPNTLPIGRNSPQKPAHGLICEKLSGSAFTAPRKENKQTFLYRILPAVVHGKWAVYNGSGQISNHEINGNTAATNQSPTQPDISQIPDQLRWSPFEAEEGKNFVTGMRLICSGGSPELKNGLAVSIYTATEPMPKRQGFYSADGDMLIVPQQGTLNVQTELGKLVVEPTEIVVIPRGIRFRIDAEVSADTPLRGYIMEIFGPNQFELPDLGVIGSSGCANPRDFKIPVAAYTEDYDTEWEIISKYAQKLFFIRQNHTPFDVVGWHGTHYPYKYDLKMFNAINSVSFDHLDPSIFTVLTCQSPIHGTAIADFVAIPPSMWVVAEDTYRPPWFHRNCMSEFMGLIKGRHGAKSGDGFAPGGASLHSVMSGHGPDAVVHKMATEAPLAPFKTGDNMSFMFESSLFLGVSTWALNVCGKTQDDYNSHWEAIVPTFKPPELFSGESDAATQ
ncbi:Homogentisate 1,2-dioxygenase [Leptodontidium sp. MPI-SDFR-AT-0119]|nr:Homogentisate 1,2-dioxygenase [Leptodontidium sp. MPI-SDFR-AT-0119]